MMPKTIKYFILYVTFQLGISELSIYMFVFGVVKLKNIYYLFLAIHKPGRIGHRLLFLFYVPKK